MSILSGFSKYKHYRADSNGDHKLQSFWTSSDTVEGNITEASTRDNLVNEEPLTTSLGKIKKWFSDLGNSAFKNTTNNYDPTGTDPVTGQAVAAALGTLPDPMVLRGTVGAAADNPTITALPVDGSANNGDTYKVITAGTYAGVVAKVGDLFSCNSKTVSANTWVHIPAGDDSIVIANPSGTATGNLLTVSIDGTIYSVKDENAMIKGVDYVTAGQKSGTTLGANATAEGLDTTASSAQAHAEGKSTVASGSYSHAEGEGCTASGQNAHAEGWHTTAGTCCHAEGSGSTASASYSHAEGVSTTASEEGAHAEGYSSQATKKGSHSENRAYAQGEFSHAEGLFSKAKAAQAHAEGASTLASSENQHVQGKYNVEDANGIYAHIVGNGTNSSNRSNAHTLDWSGNAWFAGDVTDGSGNVLSDKADTADLGDLASLDIDGASSTKYLRGDGTWQEVTGGVSSVNTKTGDVVLTASDVGALAVNGTAAKATADADGNTISSTYMKQGVDYVTAGKKANTTLGYKATAEGQTTTASGRIAHAEGSTTTASGDYSHSEGLSTTASGQSAHAEGSLTEATASRAHAEGVGTKASSKDQHVEGKWNVEDTNDTYAHIIGGGTSDNARKNIFTVDWNGNACDGTTNRLAPFKVVTENEYAALTTAQKNNGTIYFRTGANTPMRPVQDDGTATDLVSGNLPTGQTIKSYLNSNFYTMQITVPSSRSQTTTVPLPSGWTRNNCVIEQVYIFKFNESNVYFSDTLASEGVTFAFTGDALTAITSASAQTGWFGDTANVILRRIIQ